jgi:hypothetical protein
MALNLSEKDLLENGLPMVDEPSSTPALVEPIDPSAERNLIWKLDRHLIPILSALL